MLKTTPFHERTAALCVSHAWRRWAGYVVASSYELSHEREYHSIRAAAALFDVSPLYKYAITGKDAAQLLDHVVTRSIQALKVGQVVYTPWCDAQGKVLDDGTVARLGEHSFRLTAAEPNLRWLQDNAAGLDVSIKDVSESMVALSLQGPASRAILGDIDLRYFRLVESSISGIPVTISRTGYTGDLGYEIWAPASQAIALWDALIEAGT
jgi:aminomethyltransferase